MHALATRRSTLGVIAVLAIAGPVAAAPYGSPVEGWSPAPASAPTKSPAPAARPDAVPADFTDELARQAAQRFNANDVRSFVYRIFAMYEHATNGPERVAAEAFRPYIADDVHVDFPDYRIRDWPQFVEWHRWIHSQLVGDEHLLGPIAVRVLEHGRYEAEFVVRWRALFRTGKFVDVRVQQTWTLRDEPTRPTPVIERYVARLVDAPPGADAAPH